MLASIGRIPESVDDNYQQLHRYARESSNPRQLNKFIDLCNKQKDTHNITFEIDYRNNIGQTPLWVACFLGHESTAKILVRHGADVNARASDNSTPMHAAIGSSKSSIKLMVHLIEQGGNYRFSDKQGRDPVDWLRDELNYKKSKMWFGGSRKILQDKLTYLEKKSLQHQRRIIINNENVSSNLRTDLDSLATYRKGGNRGDSTRGFGNWLEFSVFLNVF